MSWNPVTGCKHGCEYCYARSISRRFGKSFEPTMHMGRLHQPDHEKKGKKIFVCSMADLFGDWVPESWIVDVLGVCGNNSRHTFQFLTKNPKRLVGINWPGNCWVGASATTQAQLDDALRHLRNTNATIRFLSVEPMLEDVSLGSYSPEWVIIGPATGPMARRLAPRKEWIRRLTDQAHQLGAAVFWKPAADRIMGRSLREFPLEK